MYVDESDAFELLASGKRGKRQVCYLCECVLKNTPRPSTIYYTVLFATGRVPETAGIRLDVAGVALDEQSGKIRASNEQTSVAHIFAVGDIVYGAPELTPVDPGGQAAGAQVLRGI